MSIVAERIKGLRESIRLSQKELGGRIGITQSAVNRYENSQSEANYKTLLAYADYFDVSLDYIYGRTDQPQGRNELVTICHQLKLEAADGKRYLTDVANTKGILRIIQSIPSPNKLMALTGQAGGFPPVLLFIES